MKKMFLGAVLFLGGIIGFAGWSIACALTVQAGSVRSVFAAVNTVDEFFVLDIFVVMAVLGMVFCAKEAMKP